MTIGENCKTQCSEQRTELTQKRMAKQKRKQFCRPKCRICRFRLDRFSKYSGRTCFWCYLSRWEPIPFNKNTPSMFDPSSMRDKRSTMGNGKIVGERDYIISFHHFFWIWSFNGTKLEILWSSNQELHYESKRKSEFCFYMGFCIFSYPILRIVTIAITTERDRSTCHNPFCLC